MRKILALTFAILMTMSAAASAAMAATAQAEENPATLSLATSDYAPGQVVSITGTSWQPYEMVGLTVRQAVDGELAGTVTMFVQADGEGRISTSEFTVPAGNVRSHFMLVANGSSSDYVVVTSFMSAAEVNPAQ